jgi:dTDP-4-dehydrorhamnose reductase
VEENQTKRKELKTILIYGVSSFVGSNLAEYFKKDYKVVGTYFKNPVNIPGVLTLPCDILNKERVSLVAYIAKPDLVIYCVGLSSLVDCGQDNALADALNASGVYNVSDTAQRYKAQLCYISSGFVFGGEDRNYIEMDIPDSNSIYGKTKASAEFLLQKSSLNYIIFRCCQFYGRGINPKQFTWFENFQRKIARNDVLNIDNVVRTGFLDVFMFAGLLKFCFEKQVSNRLLQVSSSNIMTHYEFANAYREIFKEKAGTINKSKWFFPLTSSPGTTANAVNLNYKMDVANIEGYLNIKMPTVQDSLEFTYSRFNGEKSKKGSDRTNSVLSYI